MKNSIFIPSPNFEPVEEKRDINSIIIHYTGMKTGAAAIGRLCDSNAKVSAHYFIDSDGSLFQLVEENNIAWHAGVSKFDKFEAFNRNSIGIEIANPGHTHGYTDFTLAQYRCLIALCLDIQSRYTIIPKLVLGHSDVAPQRKVDPGEKFDWKLLNNYGIGLMPPENLLSLRPKIIAKRGENFDQAIFEMQKELSDYGYDITASGIFDTASENVVSTFNTHYYQQNIVCTWDENSQRIIRWLSAQY